MASGTELPRRVEVALADYWQFNQSITPSDQVVIINIDEEAVRKMGYYPFDRRLMARVLVYLKQAQSDRIYVDAGLSTPESATDDYELEKAIHAVGPDSIALPVSQVESADGSYKLIRPLPRFAKHATLVTSKFDFDPHRKVRSVKGLPSEELALSADWLNRRADFRGAELPINFQFSASKVRRYDFLDVAYGRVNHNVLKGKKVIIGITIKSPQFTLIAPVQGPIVRAEAIAIAAETAKTNYKVKKWSLVQQIVLVLLVALLCSAIIYRLNWRLSFIVTTLLVVTWLPLAHYLSINQKQPVPILAPAIALIATWQLLKLDESFFGQFVSRLRNRILGVGQNALIAAIEVSAQPALVFNASGMILGQNTAFRLLIYAPNENEARTSPADHLSQIFASPTEMLQIAEKPDTNVRKDIQIIGKNQEYQVSIGWVQSIAGPLAVANLTDVTEERERERRLTQLAFKDALTGVGNRTAFEKELKTFSEAASQYPFAIILIDLDGFKMINDQYGHAAGDQLLIAIANRVDQILDPKHFFARLGGDEFAVIHLGDNLSAIQELATKLVETILTPVRVDEGIVKVGASLGAALCPMHHQDSAVVTKLADTALYLAKKQKPAYAIHGSSEPMTILRADST